jgi:hypothetical protein
VETHAHRAGFFLNVVWKEVEDESSGVLQGGNAHLDAIFETSGGRRGRRKTLSSIHRPRSRSGSSSASVDHETTESTVRFMGHFAAASGEEECLLPTMIQHCADASASLQEEEPVFVTASLINNRLVFLTPKTQAVVVSLDPAQVRAGDRHKKRGGCACPPPPLLRPHSQGLCSLLRPRVRAGGDMQREQSQPPLLYRFPTQRGGVRLSFLSPGGTVSCRLITHAHAHARTPFPLCAPLSGVGGERLASCFCWLASEGRQHGSLKDAPSIHSSACVAMLGHAASRRLL